MRVFRPGYYIDYTNNLMVVYPSGEFDIFHGTFSQDGIISWVRMTRPYLHHWLEDAVYLSVL
jgi:hypothetical protein